MEQLLNPVVIIFIVWAIIVVSTLVVGIYRLITNGRSQGLIEFSIFWFIIGSFIILLSSLP